MVGNIDANSWNIIQVSKKKKSKGNEQRHILVKGGSYQKLLQLEGHLEKNVFSNRLFAR